MEKKYLIGAGLVVLGVFAYSMYGKKEESEFLDFFTIDLDNCEDKLIYLRYFSPGTCIVFLTLCILFWKGLTNNICILFWNKV